jgi:hypothetical protein
MKKILMLGALFAFGSMPANAKEPRLGMGLECLLSEKVQVFQTKAELSSRLDLKDMAEKNGRYNIGDAVSVDEAEHPFRQFIVGGTCDDLIFVAFNYGGVTSGQEIDFYQARNSRQRPVARYYLRSDITDFQSLKAFIKSGKAIRLNDSSGH